MATLSLCSCEPATVKADALVVGVTASRSGPTLHAEGLLPAGVRDTLSGALTGLGMDGAAGEVVRVPAAGGVTAGIVVLVGMGRSEGGDGAAPAVDAEALRRAAGSAVRALAGLDSVALALPHRDAGQLAAVCEGALLGAYAFHRYRTAATTEDGETRPAGSGTASPRPPVSRLIVMDNTVDAAEGARLVERSRILTEAVNATRDLVNASPAELYPGSFADQAVAAVSELPVEVTVMDEECLAAEGCGGLLGVGMGSARPPRMVRLGYAPEGARAHLALVGKGITFDSGGLSIKPAQGMDAMKSDMAGAAAALHTLVAVARLGLPIRLTVWLALAENMPSGTAQRPSDVLTIRGGRTVEVLNTDAEGRLVLADAIVAASETGPDLIVDIATLTGAQIVALGARTAAIMSNDDDLRDRLHRLASACGEQFWPMPLPEELRASMDSAVADIANMGDRYGGMLVAGLFLREFVGHRPAPDGDGEVPIPWAHLDIAGPAFNTGTAYGYAPVGGTGVAVRTLLGLAEDLVDRNG